MAVIAQLLQAGRLTDGVVVGKILRRLEEGRPNESMCRHSGGCNELEVTRCTEVMV